jgi:hypothetical protein
MINNHHHHQSHSGQFGHQNRQRTRISGDKTVLTICDWADPKQPQSLKKFLHTSSQQDMRATKANFRLTKCISCVLNKKKKAKQRGLGEPIGFQGYHLYTNCTG